MPGKMTILDHLVKSGRIKKPLPVFKNDKFAVDELTFPAIRWDDEAGGLVGSSHPRKITPARQVYQAGIDRKLEASLAPVRSSESAAREELGKLQMDFDKSLGEARREMVSDIESDLGMLQPDLDTAFDTEMLEFYPASTDLRRYWPSHGLTPEEFSSRAEELRGDLEEFDDQLYRMNLPEYRMQIQTQTPRYRNYQRAMAARAANRAIGHDLSRRYAIAYNRLLDRGLTPTEARMYMREYFGGR